MDVINKKFKSILQGELAAALLCTFFARSIAAIGTVCLIVILGQLYGPAGVGIFALAQSVLIGAAVLAQLGMNNALMRFAGQSAEPCKALNYLFWASEKAGLFSLAFAGVIFFGREVFADFFLTKSLSTVLIGIAVSVPAFSLSFIIAGFMKGVSKPAAASLLENGAISLIAAGIILILHWLVPEGGVIYAGWAYAIAAWIVLAQGVCQVIIWINKQGVNQENIVEVKQDKKEFYSSSYSFFVMSLATFSQSVLSVFIAGYYLNDSELGLFKSSQQVAVLISFILIVINAVYPPRFSRMYYEKKIKKLELLARQSALIGTLLAAPFSLLCFVYPEWFLGLMGEEFVNAKNMLRILACAQLFNVITGPVGFLLNMTGHECLMRNISIVCNIAGLCVFAFFTHCWGALGASVALSLLLIFQNFVALLFVWKRLGIWMLPMPNIFVLFGIKGKNFLF